MFSIKTITRIVFNTLLGLGLVVVWLQFVDLNQILLRISTIDPKVLIFVFGSLVLGIAFRALRLKIFLGQIKKIAFKDLFLLNGLAMMLNFLIPIRAGDIAKGVYLGHKYQLPMNKSLVWIFLDRLLDFVGAVILASTLLIFVPTKLPDSFIYICLGLSFAILLSLFLISYQRSLSQNLANTISGLLVSVFLKKHFLKLANFLLDSFQVFKREGAVVLILSLLTVLGYVADGLVWYFIFIGLGSFQPFLKMYLAQVISALTYLVPAAPGYVGSAEASGLLVLSAILGIESNLASAVIVLFHITIAVFVIVIGILSLYLLKIDLGEILNKVIHSDRRAHGGGQGDIFNP